jgi:hypothetical protein
MLKGGSYAVASYFAAEKEYWQKFIQTSSMLKKRWLMNQAEIEKKWPLRDSLLADILPAISNAGEESDFATSLFIALQANADLRTKITANRGHTLISQKMIIGYVPPRAKPVVRKFISELLINGGKAANC